jgi:hypothetical protein
VEQVLEGHPTGDLTRDDILDNITLYWLTNTGISSARLYWENKAAAATQVVMSARLACVAASRCCAPCPCRPRQA